jgi:tagaturonate reductase
MQLKKENLATITNDNSIEKIMELPEKILQFGTGVLLRALPDYFVDLANKKGVFNGRIVVVKSTGTNVEADYENQNNLYTICLRGIINKETVKENIVNASISRVLHATQHWQQILACASNPEINIVISNTTEVGIQLVLENVTENVPTSFPGKLLKYLIERHKAFAGDASKGLIILPTELVTNNGTLLKSIVLQLAAYNNLSADVINWIDNCNHFCNTLVDRIVTGKPNPTEFEKLETELGYKDNLLTNSEVFCLWAIEGNDVVKKELSFATVNPEVKIEADITLFKELKLRLLNGTHTFNCGTAFLSGFDITRDAVQNEIYGEFTKNLMTEIGSSIPFIIDEHVKADFAANTFERFCNPFIDHQWLAITVQFTSKMKMRNVPLILQYYKLFGKPPVYMSTGFAAYILYMHVVRIDGGKYYGVRNGVEYEIKDDSSQYFYEIYQNNTAINVAEKVMQNNELWGTNLTELPGFLESVQEKISAMESNGVLATVNELLK